MSSRKTKESLLVVAQTYNTPRADIQRIIDEVDAQSSKFRSLSIVFAEKAGATYTNLNTRGVNVTTVQHPNVGREFGSYFQYVVDNYDSLDGVIIFISANIGKHNRLKIFQKFLRSNSCYQCNASRMGLLVGRYDFTLNEYLNLPLTPAAPRPFGAWFEEYIGPWPGNLKYVCLNGMIKTHAKYVTAHPLEFFEEFRRQSAVSKDTEVGHYFERAIYYIFGPGLLPKNEIGRREKKLSAPARCTESKPKNYAPAIALAATVVSGAIFALMRNR